MPSTLTYPGIYIEEIPSGVRTIVGVSTSDTAFVDFFARGPLNIATRITSFGDFARTFGGLDTRSESSYAIQQFFLNGGSTAWVVRVAAGSPQSAHLTLQGGNPAEDTLTVRAANEGVWGQNVQVAVDTRTQNPATQFNLVARELQTVNGRRQVVRSEVHRNLGIVAGGPNYAVDVVNAASGLVRLTDEGAHLLPAVAPNADVTGPAVVNDAANAAFTALTGAASDDGTAPDGNALIGSAAVAPKTGLNALDNIAPAVFNILCLPAAANLDGDGMRAVIAAAEAYCELKRAFLIVDIPATTVTPQNMLAFMADNDTLRHRNAAIFFPRLLIPDALNDNRPRNVAASGTLAGVFARTDATRGVWKAPAGTDATLRGASLTATMTDGDDGGLNPLGINALRAFPIFGNVSWGARTLDGADIQASEWKYIPVRRTALFIEESLFQGLKWVVFEPNDEPLWAQIRLNVGTFMQGLFRQGAFQGKTPLEAFFVRCDRTTTTQDDINKGIVNIVVGFAPLKPAEFVVIQIQQMAGQLAT